MKFATYNMNERTSSFPYAFVRRRNKLFFSTLNNNLIYDFNMDTGKMNINCFPKSKKRPPSYRGGVVFDGALVFIPEYEDFFAYIESGAISSVLSRGHYVSYCLENNLLFLLDRERFCIDVFDLKKRAYMDFFPLPKVSEVDVYINLVVENNWIYVFCPSRRIIIKLNLISRVMEELETEHAICHGALVEGKIYYVSNITDLEAVYCFDLVRRKTRRMIDVHYESNAEIQYYRFWNARVIEQSIYFLPHETMRILRYDIETNSVKYISPFPKGSRSLRPDGSPAVYGIVPYEKKLFVMPYYGDTVSVLDYDGNIIKTYQFPIPKEQQWSIMADALKNDFLYEPTWSLDEYINYISGRYKYGQMKKWGGAGELNKIGNMLYDIIRDWG